MESKTLTELGGALSRIAELDAKKIIVSEDAGEKRALDAFVTTTLRANAGDLLARWAIVENEYKPLVQGMAGLLGTAFQVIQQRQSIPQPPPKEERQQPEPSSVVSLQQPPAPDNVKS
jgi:hypothetical protein